MRIAHSISSFNTLLNKHMKEKKKTGEKCTEENIPPVLYLLQQKSYSGHKAKQLPERDQ